MATYTSHYNLKKPATSDKIRIADFNGNADTIDATMYDNATLGAQLKADIGIVENTNTATHNISAGQYVIWKGDLYTASSAISSGATLSNANLTAVSGGGLNALNSEISNFVELTPSNYLSFNQNITVNTLRCIQVTPRLMIIYYDISGTLNEGETVVGSATANCKLSMYGAGRVSTTSGTYPATIVIISNGAVRIHSQKAGTASAGSCMMMI